MQFSALLRSATKETVPSYIQKIKEALHSITLPKTVFFSHRSEHLL
jgi:hypothetical protein